MLSECDSSNRKGMPVWSEFQCLLKLKEHINVAGWKGAQNIA